MSGPLERILNSPGARGNGTWTRNSWCKKAAEQQHQLAMFNLGTFYHHGQVTLHTDPLDEASSDLSALSVAYLLMHLTWSCGQGLAKDVALAVRWYRAAAEAGEMRAANNLGVCYEKGHGLEQDYDHAVRWYRQVRACDRAELVGSHGRWKRPCLQTAHMAI